MLRNILRTSRWLARKKINSFTPVILRKCALLEPLDFQNNCPSVYQFSTSSGTPQPEEIAPAIFEEICSETLESLCEYFEELVDQSTSLKGADVTYSDGVLTVTLGPEHGTYVINRQTPNKQLWLSSPTSGPKRYDLILQNGGYWVYKHDGVTLHQLLQEEISKIIDSPVNFKNCTHSYF